MTNHSNHSDAQLVVVDEGSNQIKCRWVDSDSGKVRSLIIASNVTMENLGTDDVGDLLCSNYKINGTNYFVYGRDRKESRLPTKNARFQTSPENRALVHEALRMAGFGGQKVRVVCTLPINQFFLGDGQANVALINKKRESIISTEIKNLKKGVELAEIVSCGVMAESIPAWFDQLIDDELVADKEKSKSEAVLVVDIGGTTTDITLINGVGSSIKRTTVKQGVFDIANGVRAALSAEMNVLSVSDNQMNQLLRTKRFADENVTTLINQATAPVQAQILAAMIDFEENPQSLNHILFAGGGAGLFGQALADTYLDGGDGQNVIIAKNPEFAVASGILKTLLRQESQKKSTTPA